MSPLPKVGDAVQTPDGPGELIGFADGSRRSWRWGSAVVEGPYVVHLTDGLVRGYTFDQVRISEDVSRLLELA